jgi:hypothetical protein
MFYRWRNWSLNLENFYYKSEIQSIALSLSDAKFRENTVKTEMKIIQKKYESKLAELGLLIEKLVIT